MVETLYAVICNKTGLVSTHKQRAAAKLQATKLDKLNPYRKHSVRALKPKDAQ